METKWLEDIVSLAETGSFSRSAELRHVTQPGFSRRIRSLEDWVGTELVNRRTYPLQLTPAGKLLAERSRKILTSLHAMRQGRVPERSADCQMDGADVAASLALSRVPEWMSAFYGNLGWIRSPLMAMNDQDAMALFIEGKCDQLIAFHHWSQAPVLDSERYDTVCLGSDVVAPYVKANSEGQPLFRLPGSGAHPIPYLAYSPSSYLGRIVKGAMATSDIAVHLECVCETDVVDILKAMALAGRGIAFLPTSAILRELKEGQLVSAVVPTNHQLKFGVEIFSYRHRSAETNTETSKASATAQERQVHLQSVNADAKALEKARQERQALRLVQC